MKRLKFGKSFVCFSLIVVLINLYINISFLTNFSDTERPPGQTNISAILRDTNKTVVIAIIMHNPVYFLETTLKSLSESDHKADVWIFNNFVSDDFSKLVQEWYPDAYIIPDRGCENSTNIRLHVMDKFLSSNFHVLVTLNSYLTLTQDWWNILQSGLTESHGMFSLYGTGNYERHPGLCSGSLCSQTWLGDVGSVWRRSLAVRMIAETSNLPGNFSGKWESWCHLNNVPIQVVRKSAISISKTVRAAYSNMAEYKVNIKPNDFKNTAQLFKNNAPMKEANQNEKNNRFSLLPNCIAAVIMVRIYRDDKPELTTYELEQWIRYMQYAGVDVVYLYDAYEREGEKLDFWVKEIFKPTEVKYHDYYFNRTFNIMSLQRSAYQHAVDHYKDECEWHLQFDMDEYPFVVEDVDRGFLNLLLHKAFFSRRQLKISEQMYILLTDM